MRTHLKMLVVAAVLALVTLFCAPAVAEVVADPAATSVLVPNPFEQPLEFLGLVADAGKNRQWLLVGVLGMVGLIGALRRFAAYFAMLWAGKVAGKFFAFLLTDRGGALLAFLTTAFGYLAVALGSGHPLNAAMVFNAVLAAFTVIGGYVGVRKIGLPNGAAKAEQITAEAEAVGQKASEGSEAAADLINSGLKR